MPTLRFKSEIKIQNGNPYLLVSAARAALIKKGWRKPMPVLVRINGKPKAAWRINMMPIGDGRFYLYLHGDVRKASGTTVGDRVSAEVRFDAALPRRPHAHHAVMVSLGIEKESEGKEGLGSADSESQERNPPVFLLAQIGRGPRS